MIDEDAMSCAQDYKEYSDDNYDIVSPDEVEECRRQFEVNGVEGCKQFLQERQAKWKKIPLNVAVIGNSGVGKSSFINAIRDLTADDEGAAGVGVTECTTEIHSYSHPNNAQLKFWDLPGVGTDKFPKDNYLELIHVDRYDFFLLLTATRFTENDTWLGSEITKHDKKYLFVRTKLGNDISNDRKAHPKNHKEEEVIREIRESSMEHLKAHGHEDTKVFLVDSYKPQKFDFVELEQTLIRDFPVLKRSAMILSMGAFSEEMVKLKVAELRCQIWKTAALSAAVGAIPLPGLSFMFDTSIVTREAEFFFEQLGLDDKSLKQHAQATGTDFQQLKAVVTRTCGPTFLSLQSLKSLVQSAPKQMTSYITSMAVEEVSRFIPFVGSALASCVSYGGTYLVLKILLDKQQTVALEVVHYAAEHAALPLDDDD